VLYAVLCASDLWEEVPWVSLPFIADGRTGKSENVAPLVLGS
jgi:hypothetical protein